MNWCDKLTGKSIKTLTSTCEKLEHVFAFGVEKPDALVTTCQVFFDAEPPVHRKYSVDNLRPSNRKMLAEYDYTFRVADYDHTYRYADVVARPAHRVPENAQL